MIVIVNKYEECIKKCKRSKWVNIVHKFESAFGVRSSAEALGYNGGYAIGEKSASRLR